MQERQTSIGGEEYRLPSALWCRPRRTLSSRKAHSSCRRRSWIAQGTGASAALGRCGGLRCRHCWSCACPPSSSALGVPADTAAWSFEAGDAVGLADAAAGMRMANVIEPHKASLAELGTALCRRRCRGGGCSGGLLWRRWSSQRGCRCRSWPGWETGTGGGAAPAKGRCSGGGQHHPATVRAAW